MSDFDDFIDGFYPYRKETTNYRAIPDEPRDRADVLAEITSMAQREDATGDELRMAQQGVHERHVGRDAADAELRVPVRAGQAEVRAQEDALHGPPLEPSRAEVERDA